MVRRDFQEAKRGSSPVKDLWDIAVSDALRDDAIKLFEDYAQLAKVKFTRALQNIADMITRVASHEDFNEDSEWQKGPRFLRLPVEEWSITSAKELAAAARDSITKLQKKPFVAALTRAKARKQYVKQALRQEVTQTEQSRSPAGSAVQTLVDVRRFSTLCQLVETVA